MSLSNDQNADFELVTALRGGCRISFKSLYIKYSGRIYYVAKRFRVSHEEAENVVQDVFMKIWEKKDSLNPELSFKAYIQTIAKNEMLKAIRKAALEHAQQHYLTHTPGNNSCATEEMTGFSELTTMYHEVINRLSGRRRQIFLLNRESGLSVDEIARMTELSVRTVENHIFQATRIVRNELREQMDPNENPGEFYNSIGSSG